MIIKGHNIRRVRRTLDPSGDFWTLRPRQPRFPTPAPGLASSRTPAAASTLDEPAPEAAAPEPPPHEARPPEEPPLEAPLLAVPPVAAAPPGVRPLEPLRAPEETPDETPPREASASKARPLEAPAVAEAPTSPEAAPPSHSSTGVLLQAAAPEPGEAWQALYARSTTSRRARRTRTRLSRARALARTAFVLISLLASAYYWVGPGLQLRPERTAMAGRVFEWWQGMRGVALTHHRAGLQVAYLDPQTGRLFGVWDAQADVELVKRLLLLLPEGQWAAVTVLTPGDVETTTLLQDALQEYGWVQEVPPHGAAAAIFSRSTQPGQLQLIHAQVSSDPALVLSLPRGMAGQDGTRLASSFYIHVAE